jgi:hypothetical protein
VSLRALDKTLTTRGPGGQLFVAPGKLLYVLETNGALDRSIDPDDITATETLASGALEEDGSGDVTYPLTSNGDGKFTSAWFDETVAYDLYVPQDATNPITRWNAGGAGGGSDNTIVGIDVPPLTSAEDGMTWVYDDATGAMVWTALPGGSDSPEAWIDLTSALKLGWTNAGDPNPVAYRIDRERVYLRGTVQYYVDGASSAFNVIQLTTGYRPLHRQEGGNLWTMEGATTTATRRQMWSWFVSTGGVLSLGGNSTFSASPDFGGPPEGTVLNLSGVSFPIDVPNSF